MTVPREAELRGITMMREQTAGGQLGQPIQAQTDLMSISGMLLRLILVPRVM